MLLTMTLVRVGASAVSAHEDFRVIGTLMKVQSSSIDVKNKKGKTTSIRLDKQTAISQDKKKVDVTELKVGRSVVVDAYGDSEQDLLALEIRIVPAIAGRAK
jgi:hypothetical protein